MEFLAALKTVYETRNSDDELNAPFLIYSRAADLIGNSYENKKKLALFFAVSKRLNLLMLLSSFQLDGVNAIREQFSAVADLLSESAFNRLIDALIDVIGIVTPEMDEDFYEPYDNGFDDDYSGSGAIVYNGVYDIAVGNECGNICDTTSGNGELRIDCAEEQHEKSTVENFEFYSGFDCRHERKSESFLRMLLFCIGMVIGLVIVICLRFLR